MALCAELLYLLWLVADLPYQDRYKGNDEERRVQVGDEVGFAECVVRKDRLFASQSARVKLCSILTRAPYTSQEVGHSPQEDSQEQEQQANNAPPLRPVTSLSLPTHKTLLFRQIAIHERHLNNMRRIRRDRRLQARHHAFGYWWICRCLPAPAVV